MIVAMQETATETGNPARTGRAGMPDGQAPVKVQTEKILDGDKPIYCW